MAAAGTERTSDYFGDQIPSESKKPVSRSAFGFIISGAPHFRNPYLTKVNNQLGSTLRRSRHLFDISRTFAITESVFHQTQFKMEQTELNRTTELLTLYNNKNQHQELNRIKMKQAELK
jgi:hypothetical protein